MFEENSAWLDLPRGISMARALIIAVALLTLLPANHLIPLIDRDEPRFARATEEMILRGEWVVPYFNNEYRFDKPILIYWLMRLSYMLFGVNEFAARLPSVVFATLYGLLLFEWGRRWFGVRTGFFAGLGAVTCVQLLIHGRSAVADMPMAVMVLLAQWAAFELLNPADESDAVKARRWFWVLYAGLGFGFLAKGPVAWVVPLLTWPVYRWIFRRKPLPWRRLRLAAGLPIALWLVAAWGIPALVKTRGEFWTVGMHSHVWERGLQTFQGHGAFFLYYVVVAVVSYFPWSAYLGDIILSTRARWGDRNAFLISWLLSTYLLFSFYKTKLPHYVMPAYPAFFLLMGQVFERNAAPCRWTMIWRRVVWCVGITLGLAALAVGAFAALPESFQPLRWVVFGGALLMFSLVALGARAPSLSPGSVFAPLAGVVVAMTLIGTGLRATSPAVQLLTILRGMPAGTVYGFHVFKEPSLVFYGHTRWEPLDNDEEVADFLRGAGPRVLVCEERERRVEDIIRPLLGKPPRGVDRSAAIARWPTEGYAVEHIEGLNIARASAVRLRVLYRR